MNSCAPIWGFEWPSRASSGDLRLLRGELAAHVVCALARLLAGSEQLTGGALSECFGAHCREQLVHFAQRLARLDPPVLAAKPLPVEEMCSSEFHAHTRAGKPPGRFAVEVLAASPSLRSACERASIPNAQAVPLPRVVSESRWNTRAASSPRELIARAVGRTGAWTREHD
jgi:hypothetical protein